MNENDARREDRPELEQLLKSLPRVEASEDFTRRVVEASLRGPGWTETLSKAAAVVALCAAAVFAGWWWAGDRAGWEAAESRSTGSRSTELSSSVADTRAANARALEVERLQNRMQTLQAELDELRRLAREAQPIVPLGSSEVANGQPVDYYLDLRALRSVQPEAVRTTF